MLSKRWHYITLFIALVGIPLVLLFLPASFFDHGETICPSKRYLNTECPGCGMTRGVMHAIHFDFKGAWQYNKLTFLAIPVIGFFWIKWIIISAREIGLLRSGN